LVTLCLQHCGPEQCDLLALLNAVEDLGVIKIADPETHNAWRVLGPLLDEDEHRAPGSAGSSRSPCCSALRTTAATAATTTATASTASTAPTRR
jgi:hypothetical protein